MVKGFDRSASFFVQRYKKIGQHLTNIQLNICSTRQLVCQNKSLFTNQKAKRRVKKITRRFSRTKRRVVLLKRRFVMSDLQRFTNAIISFLFAMLILNWTISEKQFNNF